MSWWSCAGSGTADLRPRPLGSRPSTTWPADDRAPEKTTWANPEGLALDPPPILEWESIQARDISTIEAAQASGHVDPGWRPMDLLVWLFAVALA